jgi:hypothetical protein
MAARAEGEPGSERADTAMKNLAKCLRDLLTHLIAKLLTDAQAPVRSVVALPGLALMKPSGRNK